MNNQDFKKLLRENIEARKEKEIEEGKIKDFFNKITPDLKKVKGLTKEDPIKNYLKNHAKEHFLKNGESPKRAEKLANTEHVLDKIRVIIKKIIATPGDSKKALEAGVTLLRNMLPSKNKEKDSEDQGTNDGTPSSDDESTGADVKEVEVLGQSTQKESKKNTLQPRLHESHQKERDEEIYNKLMKRLNNQ